MKNNLNEDKNMKRTKTAVLILTLFALLSALLFSGCACGGNRKGPQFVMGKDGKKKLKITFWHSMAGKLGEILNKMITEFNDTNKDDIFVKSEFIGEYGTLNQKIAAAVFAEIPPHMSQVYETWALQLKDENAIVCLDPFIDHESSEVRIDRTDIVPALLKNVTSGGKVYSMPFNKSIPVLYYNKNLFAAAGLDPEKPPVTWDEYIDYGKKLMMYEKKGLFYNYYTTRDEYEKINGKGSFPKKSGTGFNIVWGNKFMPDPWSFENYIFQNGGKIISDDGKKALINSPEAIEAAQYIIDKLEKHGFAERTSGREHQNEFISGRVGMIEGTIVSKVFMQNDIRFAFGMAKLPYKKVDTSVLSGTNVAIYSCFSPEEIMASWKFLRWFTSTERTAKWGVETTYMPVRKSAYETAIVKETIKKDPNMKVALTILDDIQFEPQVPSWFECRGILSKATEGIASKLDPVKVLNDAAKEMDEVLAIEE